MTYADEDDADGQFTTGTTMTMTANDEQQYNTTNNKFPKTSTTITKQHYTNIGHIRLMKWSSLSLSN